MATVVSPLEMVAEAGVELVHRLDDARAGLRASTVNSAHPAGIPPAEAGGQHDARLVFAATELIVRSGVGRGRRGSWGGDIGSSVRRPDGTVDRVGDRRHRRPRCLTSPTPWRRRGGRGLAP